MWFLASSWVLLELTDSPAWVGLLGVNAVPAIALSLLGGGVADRVSRVNLLRFGATGYLSVFLVTAVLVQFDVHSRWHFLGLSLVIGVVWAFQSPALKAVVVQLVDRSQLVTANALAELSEFTGEILAPLVVGFMISGYGAKSVYWLAVLLVFIELLLFGRMKQQPQPERKADSRLLGEVKRGIRYMLDIAPFTALLIVSMAGLFGSMLMPLIPVVARDTLDAGASGFGVLAAAFGAGLAVGSLTLVLSGERGRKMVWLLISNALVSAGIATFAFSEVLGFAAVAIFFVGLGTSIAGNMVVTLFQVSASDEMRGRAMGVYSVTSAMVPLGSILGGLLGAALGIETALLISAVASFVPVLLALMWSPALRRL